MVFCSVGTGWDGDGNTLHVLAHFDIVTSSMICLIALLTSVVLLAEWLFQQLPCPDGMSVNDFLLGIQCLI